MVTLLDGAIGTAIQERGADTSGPGWSAFVARDQPDLLQRLHADYAQAGAHVHTANTFRTRPPLGPEWVELLEHSVSLARGPGRTVFGSMAPSADCYRLRPADQSAHDEHHLVAAQLARAGVDGLLVETFCNEWEAVTATRVAAHTKLPTWTALTPGPDGRLMTPKELRHAAFAVADAGASVVLVNCVGPAESLEYIESVSELGLPFGAYLNAGPLGGGMGWGQLDQLDRWLQAIQRWLDAGATVVGGCCGTTPNHIRAIADRLGVTR